MKKIMVLFAIAALAFAAQANVVNSGFDTIAENQGTNTSASSYLGSNPMSIQLNKGWYTNTATTMGTISGGMFVRQTASTAQKSGVLQYFTETSLTGALKLQYDLLVTDANSSDAVYIQLYGYKFWTSGTVGTRPMFSTDTARMIINSTATPASSTNWTVTALVTYVYSSGTLNGGTWTTGNTVDFSDINVTAGEYDMFGLRILSSGNGAGDVVNIDNVQVVPEPSTALLFGIGSILAMVLRRKQR